jgi:hypothetical protein
VARSPDECMNSLALGSPAWLRVVEMGVICFRVFAVAMLALAAFSAPAAGDPLKGIKQLLGEGE